jgi:hypothetical protein
MFLNHYRLKKSLNVFRYCSKHLLLSIVLLTVALIAPRSTQAATLIPIISNNGGNISLQLDSDGIPVMAFVDNTDDAYLGLMNCNSATYCDNPEAVLVDPTSYVGFISLALDTNNIPHIAYQGDNTLKLARCEPIDCSSPSIQTVDSSIASGYSASIILDSADRPVIAYVDLDDQQLKIAFCADNECHSSAKKILDTNVNGLSWVSLQSDSAGNPVIAYVNNSYVLKLALCDDVTCTSSTIRTLESSSQRPSLQIDSTGIPVVAYYDVNNLNLKLGRCTSAACTTFAASTVDNSVDDVGDYPSLALDTNDIPIITYYDRTNGDSIIIYCNDLACTSYEFGGFDFQPTSGGSALKSSLVMNGDVPIYAFTDIENWDVLLYNEFNNAPMLEYNTPIKVNPGASVVINSSMLNSFDVDNLGPPDIITYTISEPPTEGTLNSATFTQNQINSGDVTYTYTGVISDQFTFTMSDGEDASQPFTFLINLSEPKVAPGRNYFTDNTPELTWGAVTYATEYQIEVSKSSTFTVLPLTHTEIVPASQLSVILPTLTDGVYYWRVHARNGTQPWSGWSVVQSFTVNS